MFISERGINFHMYPIIGKDSNQNFVKRKKNKIIFESREGSEWDLNCYTLMDCLSGIIRKRFEDAFFRAYSRKPKGSYDPGVANHCPYTSQPNRVWEYWMELDNPGYAPELRHYNVKLKIRTSEFLKDERLKKWNATTLKNTFEKISKCKVRLNYQMLSEGSIHRNGKRQHDFSNSFDMFSDNLFSSFFEFKFIPGKLGVNSKRYNSMYKINFCTPLSSTYIHNIFVGGYSLVDPKFFELSKNAQLLFRKRFLPFSGNFVATLRMNIVLNDLCLHNKNKTELRKKFIKIVEELSDYKFITVLQEDINKEYVRFKTSLFTSETPRKIIPIK